MSPIEYIIGMGALLSCVLIVVYIYFQLVHSKVITKQVKKTLVKKQMDGLTKKKEDSIWV